MKVLITGADRQLGACVAEELRKREIAYVAAVRPDFDLTDEERASTFVLDSGCDCVIHCAAYTAVDKAEDEPDICMAVNRDGTRHVARAAARIGAKMIYIGTDYCFDGTKKTPYEIDDEISPLSVYGRSKSLGEEAVREACDRHFIVRASWIFSEYGNNFVKTMLRLSAKRDVIRVVSDQYGSPTYARDLASLLCDMAASDRYGTYHAANEGFCSWAELAAETMRLAGKKTVIEPISSRDYPCKAVRPANSRLSKKSLTEGGFSLLPDWRDALGRCIEALGYSHGVS